MKHRNRHRIVALAAACVLGAGALATAQEIAAPPEARRISAQEAWQAFDADQAVIVDVRSPQDYAAEHVAGAVSIPGWQILERLGELPKDKLIITYCT